jgi:hypothetical protein
MAIRYKLLNRKYPHKGDSKLGEDDLNQLAERLESSGLPVSIIRH